MKLQVLGFRGFGILGVHESTHFEIMKLRSIPLLDPTVNFLSYDLWCGSFWDFRSVLPSSNILGLRNFGFRVFSNREFMM